MESNLRYVPFEAWCILATIGYDVDIWSFEDIFYVLDTDGITFFNYGVLNEVASKETQS